MNLFEEAILDHARLRGDPELDDERLAEVLGQADHTAEEGHSSAESPRSARRVAREPRRARRRWNPRDGGSNPPRAVSPEEERAASQRVTARARASAGLASL